MPERDGSADRRPTPPEQRPTVLEQRPTLLEQVAGAAVDNPYAAAAAERERRGEPAAPSRRRGAALAAVAAALVAGLLIAAGATQQHRSATASEQAHDRLAAEAATRQRLLAGLTRQRAALVSSAAQAQRDAVAASASAAAANIRLSAQRQAAALTRVTGPALVVTLADSTAYKDPQPGQGKVSDLDLQQVVSALWQAGAEAVAVGGQRLGPQSAIRTAGGSVLVNFVAVRSPYDVVAVGDPLALQARFTASDVASRLRTQSSLYGLRLSQSRSDSVTLPAGTVVLPVAATPAAATRR